MTSSMNVSSVPQPASYYPSSHNPSVHSHHSHHSSKHSHSLKQSTTSTTKHSNSSLTSPHKRREHKYSYGSHQSHKSHKSSLSQKSHNSNNSKSKSHKASKSNANNNNNNHSHQQNDSHYHPHHSQYHSQQKQSKPHKHQKTKSSHSKNSKSSSKNSKLHQFGKQNRKYLSLNNDDTRSVVSEQSIEYLGHIKDGKLSNNNSGKHLDESMTNEVDDDFKYWKPPQRQESLTSVNTANSLNSRSMTMNTTTTISQLVGNHHHGGMVVNPQNIYTQESGNSNASSSSNSSSSSSSSNSTSTDSRSQSNDSRSNDQGSQDTMQQYETRSITELTRDTEIERDGTKQHEEYSAVALSLQNNMDSMVIHDINDDGNVGGHPKSVQMMRGNDSDEINPSHRSHNMDDDDDSNDSADSNEEDEQEQDIQKTLGNRNRNKMGIQKPSEINMRLNVIPPQNKPQQRIKMKNIRSNTTNNSFLSSETGSVAAESSVLSPLSDHMNHIINGHQIYHSHSHKGSHKSHYNGHYIHGGGHHHVGPHLHHPMDRIHPTKHKSNHSNHTTPHHHQHHHHQHKKSRSGNNRHHRIKNNVHVMLK